MFIKRSKIIVMSNVCASLILGLLLGCSEPQEIAPVAGATTSDRQVLKAASDANESSVLWDKDLVRKDEKSAKDCPETIEGQVCQMNWADANAYCRVHGKKLPTVREQAQWSHSNGAKGIQETDPRLKDLSIDDDKVKVETEAMKATGYRTIYKKNDFDQVAVDFYFNPDGYIPPSDDLGKYITWSLSVYAYDFDVIYFLNSAVGDFDGEYSSAKYAVRCVVDH